MMPEKRYKVDPFQSDVTAIQYTGDNVDDIAKFMTDDGGPDGPSPYMHMFWQADNTLGMTVVMEGAAVRRHLVKLGEYLVRTDNGYLRVMTEAQFTDLYEEA